MSACKNVFSTKYPLKASLCKKFCCVKSYLKDTMQTIVLYLCYIVLILLFSSAHNTSLIYCFVIWCLHPNKRRPCSSTLSGHPSSSWLLQALGGTQFIYIYIYYIYICYICLLSQAVQVPLVLHGGHHGVGPIVIS